jgi:hypothetical protein
MTPPSLGGYRAQQSFVLNDQNSGLSQGWVRFGIGAHQDGTPVTQSMFPSRMSPTTGSGETNDLVPGDAVVKVSVIGAFRPHGVLCCPI